MDKSGVFIDNGYFSKVLKSDFGELRIDFLKLSEKLCEGTERLRTYFYWCMPYQGSPPTQEEFWQDRFLHGEDLLGIERYNPEVFSPKSSEERASR